MNLFENFDEVYIDINCEFIIINKNAREFFNKKFIGFEG